MLIIPVIIARKAIEQGDESGEGQKAGLQPPIQVSLVADTLQQDGQGAKWST